LEFGDDNDVLKEVEFSIEIDGTGLHFGNEDSILSETLSKIFIKFDFFLLIL
jgi:hypothetical protein